MDWLSAHQADVQAVTAIVSAFTTVTLAVLTAKYVSLTRQQTTHLVQASAIRDRKTALAAATLAERLRKPLGALHTVPPSHDRVRSYSQLSQTDVIELEMLARSVSDEAIATAARSVYALRVILTFIEKTRSIPAQTGWMPTDREMEEWKQAIQTADKSLGDLDWVCRTAAGQSMIGSGLDTETPE